MKNKEYMNKGIIIAAFATCGKSILGKKYKNVVDLESGVYKHKITNDNLTTEERKGTIREMNKEWPQNYYNAILKAVDYYDIVLVQLKPEHFDYFDKNNIKYSIAYPNINNWSEVEKRCIERGNNKAFITRLKEVFKPYYEDSLNRKYEKLYILNENETLEDALIKNNFKLKENYYAGNAIDNTFVDFLIRAKKSTYANSKIEKDASSRTGSSDYNYEEIIDNKKYIYHDTYFGGTRFMGEEVVYCDNDKPIWGMNYYGITYDDTLGEEAIDNALRPALMKVDEARNLIPVRGPAKFENNGYIYTFKANGRLENFDGIEQIYKDNNLIYELHCSGGIIK